MGDDERLLHEGLLMGGFGVGTGYDWILFTISATGNRQDRTDPANSLHYVSTSHFVISVHFFLVTWFASFEIPKKQFLRSAGGGARIFLKRRMILVYETN
ncbi:MAG: hypothetical protein COA47_04280 [Robiginitomaculum sp.]|nr:MAG: hypothetical protein COA47_04280 [Robiginitomaculum sp.]